MQITLPQSIITPIFLKFDTAESPVPRIVAPGLMSVLADKPDTRMIDGDGLADGGRFVGGQCHPHRLVAVVPRDGRRSIVSNAGDKLGDHRLVGIGPKTNPTRVTH